MRVVITGGSGLIGSALARELGGAGHDAVVLSRNLSRVGALPPGVRAAEWDGRSGQGWSKLLDAGTAIVHLAGESIASGRWTAEKKRRIRDSRVQSGKAVLEAVRQAASSSAGAPAVLLQGSAVGYYGPCGDEVVTEDHPSGNDFLADVCREWEASTTEVEALGVRRALLRTGIVLSLKDGALPRMMLPFRLGAGAPLGSGRQWFPWIHMADEVAAIRFLLERREASGPFNLSAPNPVTNRQLGDVLSRVVRRPNPLQALGLGVPRAVFQVALGEMAGMLLQGQRAVPRRLLDLGFPFRYPELEPALRNLVD
ncbi:MAG TPA: TIGR01777 family oxidoreductase [Thermoanaerobaculia bacterium]|nr:TIGR01777 family oxidoreductase [Thermoanaerobaculia bacterium]